MLRITCPKTFFVCIENLLSVLSFSLPFAFPTFLYIAMYGREDEKKIVKENQALAMIFLYKDIGVKLSISRYGRAVHVTYKDQYKK